MEKRLTIKRSYLTAAIVVLIVGLALPYAGTQAQQRKEAALTLEALTAKVQKLEDTQAISNVLIDYGRALDSRDFKAYAALFAKDGSWSGGLGTVTGGPQAIYDFMTKSIGGGAQRGNAGAAAGNAPRPPAPIGFGPTYHIMSSFKIDVNGDTATASSRWAFVTAARGPGVQVAGRYEDTLVREDGVWKIKSRQAFNDLTAPAASASANGTQGPAAPTGGNAR